MKLKELYQAFFVWVCVFFLQIPHVSAQTELLTNGYFFSTNYGWSTVGDWYYDSRFSNCLSCPGYAYFSNSAGQPTNNLSGELTQSVQIPSNTTSVLFQFAYRVSTSEPSGAGLKDICWIQIWDNGSKIIEHTISNQNSSSSYQASPFIYIPQSLFGKTVKVRIVAYSDGANPTTFRIDDVSIIAYSSNNNNCVSWQNGTPSDQNILQATEFLCDEGVIEQTQDYSQYNNLITRKEIAIYIKRSLFGTNNNLPSNYFPTPFVDLPDRVLSAEESSSILSMFYLDYGDGVTPFSRDYYNSSIDAAINKSDAIKAVLEAWNISPDMLGYNANSSSSSSFLSEVAVNHRNYGYIKSAYKDGFLDDVFSCSPSPCYGSENSITKREFLLFLYNVISARSVGNNNVTSNDFLIPNNIGIENSGTNLNIDRGIFTFYEKESFLIPGGGLPLEFSHTYNSHLVELPYMPFEWGDLQKTPEIFRSRVSPLGVGWNHSYSINIQSIPKTLNDNNEYKYLIQWSEGTSHCYDAISLKYLTKGVEDVLDVKARNANGNATEIEIKKKGGIRYLFRSDDKFSRILNLISITDRNGNSLELTYEIGANYGIYAQNRLSKVKDSFSGRQLSFAYQPGTNFLSSVTDNAGRVLKFTVDKTLATLVNFTDPKNQITSYRYSTDSRERAMLTEIAKPKGNKIYASYQNKKLKQVSTNDYQINVEYNPTYSNSWSSTTSSVQIIKSGTNITTNYVHNATGSPIEIKTPNETVSIQYSGTCPHKPQKIVDSKTGNETYLYYDSRCNMTMSEIISGGQTIREQFEYNWEDQITKYTDPNGNVTEFTYDGKGNLVTRIEPNTIRTSFWYLSNGLLNESSSPDGIRVKYGYNSYGNPTNVEIIGTGITSSAVYDNLSRVVSQVDEFGTVTTYSYDPNDNPLSHIVDPGGLQLLTKREYDQNDNLVKITSPRGIETTLFYTNDDELQQESCGGFSQLWAYNEDGTLKQHVDQNSNQFNYSYFLSGSKTGLVESDGYAQYEYDNQTLSVQQVKRGGTAISYQYDGFGRTTQINYNDFNGNSVGYQYDNGNRVTKIQYPQLGSYSIQLEHIYDVNNRLIEVKNAQSQKSYVRYTYFNDGRVRTEQYGNGLTTHYLYDNAGRLDSVVVINSSWVNILGYGLDRLLNGKISQERISNTYQGPANPPNSSSFLNDATFTYDQSNRLSGINGSSVVYNNWTLSQEPNRNYSYTWDPKGNLISIQGGPNNYEATIEYDALENRRRYNNTRYVLDLLNNENILAVTDLNGTPQLLFIHGLGLVCAIDPNTGKEYYYHFDSRGSTLAITDNTGLIQAIYGYEPFGRIIKSQGQVPYSNPFTYIGKYGIVEDGSGLYYMRARYYDPELGRFLSEDPIWNTNLFPYADNDPVNMIDPEGKIPIETIPDVLAVGGSFVSLIHAPSVLNAAYLAWDITSVFVPYVPGSYSRFLLKGGDITEVMKNYNRFLSKVPVNSKSSALFKILDNGDFLFQATSPGRVVGSSAKYQKWVNPKGKTIRYIKTTFDPNGKIIHVKQKF